MSFSERLADEKYDQEMLTRFVVFTQNEITSNDELRDLGRYLNKQMRLMASTINLQDLEFKFKSVFDKLYGALGEDAFRRYENGRYTGGFKLTLFEVLALGMGQLELDEINRITDEKVVEVSHSLVTNDVYISNTGSGKSASNRLKNLIELGKSLFCS